jgi:hypothetical protein
MKTSQLNVKAKSNCQFFKQLMVISLVTLTFSINAEAQSLVSRKIASFEEEVITVPLSKESFSNEVLFADDDAGILREMRDTISAWENTDEYAKTWDLKSTGQHNTPTTEARQAYISKRLLRYADKRLSGEMKNADEGSTLHKMKKVEKSLRPNATINMSKNFGLKFKARVLQGKAIVEVKNPWIDCDATVSAAGQAKIVTKKNFKELGMTSGAEYSVNDSTFVAYVDQELTKNIRARVSSSQSGGTNVFSDDADARIEMTASFPFNF